MQTTTSIKAREHAAERPAESGEKLARAACAALAQSGAVVIDFAGVRGVTSTYFNALMEAIHQKMGWLNAAPRLEFIFENDAQRSIFARSRESMDRIAAHQAR